MVGVDSPELAAATPLPLRKAADLKAIRFGALPVAFSLATPSITDAATARGEAERVVLFCRSAADGEADAAGWSVVASVIEAAGTSATSHFSRGHWV